MSKTKRRWIAGCGDTPNYNAPDALRAEDIPYDSVLSIKDAIIANVGSVGYTGLQGSTGLSSGPIGPTGATGVQGPIGGAGPVGPAGSQGVPGIQGQTGIAPVSIIPTSFSTVQTSPTVTASSTSFVDVISTSIEIDSASPIAGTFYFEAESSGPGSYPTGAFRVVINDTSTGTELQRYFLPDDEIIGSVTYESPTSFQAATYTVKGQARRVSGQQIIQITNSQLFAQAFIGGKGDLGPIGPSGATGVAGNTGVGVQGSTGLIGPYGYTGIQGITGIQGLGLTGLRGVTGVQGVGLQGVTGIEGQIVAVALPSGFLSVDSTSMAFSGPDYTNIPGLSSLSISVTANGSYIYSTLTLQTGVLTGPVEGAYCINIDGGQGTEFTRIMQNYNDLEPDTFSYRAGPFTVGTYVVSGQARLFSGSNPFYISAGTLYAQVLQGGQGPVGPVGPIGYTGLQGIGNTGIQGITGLIGPLGVGYTGIQGVTGIGVPGSTGAYGGPQGATGVGIQGATGLMGGGATGIKGVTGILGIPGGTGIQGVTGISTQSYYNPISRYSMIDTSGSEVWTVSSATVQTGLTWNRSGTDLTIYRNSHGHTVGNRVIIKNTNLDYQSALIASLDSTSFTVPTSATDGSSGAFGAYSLGFTYAHDSSVAPSGGTLFAPTGNPADVQLLSMRIRTGAPRSGYSYDVSVPASVINGAGFNTNLGTCYMPDFNVRFDSDSLTAVAASMTTGTSGNGSYSTFRIGNLGSASLSRFILLHF